MNCKHECTLVAPSRLGVGNSTQEAEFYGKWRMCSLTGEACVKSDCKRIEPKEDWK